MHEELAAAAPRDLPHLDGPERQRHSEAVPPVVGHPAERIVEGRLTGSLVREPRGTGGFGYDPAFVPDGETRTTAEMSPEEKNAISHRGRAFRELAPILRKRLTE